jgi:hypothetical protein
LNSSALSSGACDSIGQLIPTQMPGGITLGPASVDVPAEASAAPAH